MATCRVLQYMLFYKRRVGCVYFVGVECKTRMRTIDGLFIGYCY